MSQENHKFYKIPLVEHVITIWSCDYERIGAIPSPNVKIETI